MKHYTKILLYFFIQKPRLENLVVALKCRKKEKYFFILLFSLLHYIN